MMMAMQANNETAICVSLSAKSMMHTSIKRLVGTLTHPFPDEPDERSKAHQHPEQLFAHLLEKVAEQHESILQKLG
jgi:hypothetical protein